MLLLRKAPTICSDCNSRHSSNLRNFPKTTNFNRRHLCPAHPGSRFPGTHSRKHQNGIDGNQPMFQRTLLLLLAMFVFASGCAVRNQGVGRAKSGERVVMPRKNRQCNQCRQPRQRRCRKCPKCQNDVCVLDAQCVKEKRTCYEVEQKLICVPKVSLPWRKCEKPCGGDCASNCRHRCGKTKTVKVLQKKTYECNVCKYSWRVNEPNDPQSSDERVTQPPVEEPGSQMPRPEQPQFDDSELYDPAGDDVPAAPVMSESATAILNQIRKR